MEPTDPREITVLLRGEAQAIDGWIGRWQPGRLALYVLVIFAGAGLLRDGDGMLAFAAAGALHRHQVSADHSAHHAGQRAAQRQLLAPLLGLGLAFRQSLLAILMSFTVVAVILGAFSPVLLFLVLNTPPLGAGSAATAGYQFILLSQVVVIAFAGIAGTFGSCRRSND